MPSRSPAPRTLKQARSRVQLSRRPRRQRFPFLSLPREIRDRVYIYVITNGPVVVKYALQAAFQWETTGKTSRLIAPEFGSLFKVQYDTTSSSYPQSRFPSAFSVLLANKKISAEAASVLYGTHPFLLRDQQADAFRTLFAPSIGATNTSLIKRVHMTLPQCLKAYTTRLSPSYTALFAQMPHLKEVIVSTHFYAHSHYTRIAVEYSSMLFFSSLVVTTHPRLSSATFLDMGLQEALHMRNDATLSPSDILRAQIEIKVKLSARTTSEELVQVLSSGGMMLDANKIAAAGEMAVYRSYDPKIWALDCGQPITAVTTVPAADVATLIAAAEDKGKGKGKVKMTATVNKIISLKTVKRPKAFSAPSEGSASRFIVVTETSETFTADEETQFREIKDMQLTLPEVQQPGNGAWTSSAFPDTSRHGQASSGGGSNGGGDNGSGGNVPFTNTGLNSYPVGYPPPKPTTYTTAQLNGDTPLFSHLTTTSPDPATMQMMQAVGICPEEIATQEAMLKRCDHTHTPKEDTKAGVKHLDPMWMPEVRRGQAHGRKNLSGRSANIPHTAEPVVYRDIDNDNDNTKERVGGRYVDVLVDYGEEGDEIGSRTKYERVFILTESRGVKRERKRKRVSHNSSVLVRVQPAAASCFITLGLRCAALGEVSAAQNLIEAVDQRSAVADKRDGASSSPTAREAGIAKKLWRYEKQEISGMKGGQRRSARVVRNVGRRRIGWEDGEDRDGMDVVAVADADADANAEVEMGDDNNDDDDDDEYAEKVRRSKKMKLSKAVPKQRDGYGSV